MDAVDRRIVDRLQDGIPVVARPFAVVAAELGLEEAALIARLSALRARGVLSRFGPMYDAERLGGRFCLCALAVPAERFDAVAAAVNVHPEVAHNYARDHRFNMWFVLATERPERIDAVVTEIERETGLTVLALPKLTEFQVRLRLSA